MMNRILMLSCAVVALGMSTPTWAKEPPPQQNSDEVFAKLNACPALKDRKAYEEKKVDSYAVLVPGKNGWLFRSDSDFKTDFEFHKDSIAKFLQLQKTLESKGTKLFIAYLPNRGILAADYIPMDHPEAKNFDVAKAKASYAEMADGMRKQGLRFITMDTPIEAEKFYRKTDHHWNINGTREFAKVVAEEIKKDDVYDDLKKTEYESVSKGIYYLEGRFGDATKKLCDIKLVKEQDEEILTSPKGGDVDEGSLFGDTSMPEIVLVGTSNSKRENYNPNFDGFLKEFLSADIQNNAFAGAGIDDPMIAYLQSDEFHKNPPKVLIWEIPGYYVLTKEGGRFLNELVPAALGECDDAEAEFTDVKLEDKEQVVLTDIADEKFMGGEHYLHMEFSKPVDKNFSVFFKYKDSDEAKYRFKRTKRYPFDGLFNIMLPDKEADGKGKATLSSIEIAPDKKMLEDGLTVSGKICPVPEDLVIGKE